MSLIRLSDVTYLHQNQKLCSRIHWLARPWSCEHQWSEMEVEGRDGDQWNHAAFSTSSQWQVLQLCLHLFFHFIPNTFCWLLFSTLLLSFTKKKKVPQLLFLSPGKSVSHVLISPWCSVVPGCQFSPVLLLSPLEFATAFNLAPLSLINMQLSPLSRDH